MNTKKTGLYRLLDDIFSIDGKLFIFLDRFSDLVLLNILFLITSIPIFTIGASLTACYQCSFGLLKGKGGGIIKQFFLAFKQNFHQATPIWISMLLTGAFLTFEFNIIGHIQGIMGNVSKVFLITASLLLLIIFIYAFPLISMFKNSRKQTVKNSFLLALGNFPQTILLSGLAFIPILLISYFPQIFTYWFLLMIIIGVELTIMITSRVLQRVFKRLL
ncbi:YesL family protein [Lapidilactobacillus salsurivasis]